jgi:hypothetical protein
VQVSIHELRRALGGPGPSGLPAHGYALVLEAAELDAAEFGQLLAEGRTATGSGSPALAPGCCAGRWGTGWVSIL